MKRIVLLLSLFIVCQQVYGTHLVGGDITYECMGFDSVSQTYSYHITMYIYRDCFNGQAPFDDPANISIYNATSLVPVTTLQVNKGPTVNIPPVSSNPCLTPPANLCVEQAVYDTTVSLPFSAGGYTIAYTRCCRNGTINNIIQPGQTGFTIACFISDLAQTSCNSSPRFLGFPPIVICNNDPLVFDHSATDAQGDSIVYSFCAPYVGASPTAPNPPQADPPPYTDVTYTGSYFSTAPMGGNPTISIDPHTGLITGTPQSTGQYVVAVCVEEYRNGVLLTSMRRDFQFNVTNCIPAVEPTPIPDTSATVNVGGVQVIEGRSCDETVVFNYSVSAGNSGLVHAQTWTFSDPGGFYYTANTLSTTVQFPHPGLYNGKIVTNPGLAHCSDSTLFQVRIYPPRQAIYGYIVDTCTTHAIRFRDSSIAYGTGNSIAAYQWNFGDGLTSTASNPNHFYASPGIYTTQLTITDANGCTATTSHTTAWYPPLPAAFTTPDNNGCTAFTATLNNTTTPQPTNYTYVWTFGDTSSAYTGVNPPPHTYYAPGQYDVSLSVTSPWACNNTSHLPHFFTAFGHPTAHFNFSYDSCVIGPVTFTDQSTPFPGSTNTHWHWDFGDNTTSTQHNPVHQYGPQTAGDFVVTLVVTDTNGCSDSIQRTVHWFPAPVIDVNVSQSIGCAPQVIVFTNNSYPINGYTTLWDFGDSQSSLVASPTHTYAQHGTYVFHLTITSPTGCVKTYSDTVWVLERPHAHYHWTFDTCAIAPVTFADLSTTNTAGTPLTTWEWSMGDGHDTLTRNIVYQYTNSDSFHVQLVVTDSNHCTDTTSQTVPWFPEPVVDVVVQQQEGCFGDTVRFINNSYPINGYTTLWVFGDGDSSLLASPSHVFSHYGVFPVTLTITSPTGWCHVSHTVTITVHELPHADFNYFVDGCHFVPVVYTDVSHPNTAGDPLQQWHWAFGDGRDTLAQNPTHTPALAGTLPVTLTVTDNHGCKDDTTRQVYWAPEPVIDVQIQGVNGCLGNQVVFQNNSYPINGYTTAWNFGDTHTSLLASPTHLYASPGVYPINLVITSPNGNCVKTFRDTVVVNGLPIAAFGYGADSCILGPIHFTDSSIAATFPFFDSITQWHWNFGDGHTSNLQNIIYQYAAPGTYTIQLTVTDQTGCQDSIRHTISWFPAPPIQVVADHNTGCEPQTINFSFSTGGFPVTGYGLQWNFGDATTFNGAAPPPHTYLNNGVYVVTLTLTAPAPPFCTQLATDTITIYDTPVASFAYHYDSCALTPIHFTDLSHCTTGNITQWSWIFPHDTVHTQNPTHGVDSIGVYPLHLVVTDEHGCTNRIDSTVNWQPRPIYSLHLTDRRGCTPFTLVLRDSVYPLADYTTRWSFGDGTYSTSALPPPHLYPVTGDYRYTLTVQSIYGCVDSFSAIAHALPLPVAGFTYNPTDPSNLQPGIQIHDQSIDAVRWHYSVANQTFTIPDPAYVFPDTGIYYITQIVTHHDGCTDTLVRPVDVAPKYTWFFPNAFTPDGDNVNDVFNGNGIVDKIRSYTINIWNRWGEMVFTTTNPREGWNGQKLNTGKICENGVYVFTATIIGGRGERSEYKGFVTLVR